jgi:predicted NBD/HSP70 family sugar kinase
MGKQRLLKALNRATILNTIRRHGAVARTDIARVTGLSVAAVTGLTAELIRDGLIYEKQEGDSRGGRPPILLALQPDGAHVIGLKLAEDHITFALTNLDADVMDRLTLPVQTQTPEAVADKVVEGIHLLPQPSHVAPSRVLGVGIGLSGIIDAEAGICRQSPTLGWRDVPFADLLKARIDSPIYMDNNANALALVEKLYGAGVGLDHFLTVTIGRGIGMGIVANGEIYRGIGGAGEFGHTVVDPQGYVCDCGKRGCLETLASDPWLLRHAAERALVLPNPDSLLKVALAGNPVAISVLRGAGETLGRSIANLINLFHPQLIVLSGEGVRYGDLIMDPLREMLRMYTMPVLIDDVKLTVEPLGDDAWARGAASLVLQELFRVPQADLEGMVGV